MGKMKAIICEVMREEWMAINIRGVETRFLEQGLHIHPEKLHEALQNAIDETDGCDIVFLGYGLCSNALLGLKATKQSLIIPLVEDCISLFLGSAASYLDQFKAEPATYYFTKGWIVNQKDPYQEYLQCCKRWGEEEAQWIAHEMMKNYRRAVYIDTQCYDISEYYAYMCKFAKFFGLKPEKITGSLNYLEEITSANWQRCLIVAPGEEISEEKFRNAMKSQRSD